jgi:SAM-dependent methyltransferase
MYVSRTDEFVWIERDGERPWLITPEKADEFVREITPAGAPVEPPPHPKQSKAASAGRRKEEHMSDAGLQIQVDAARAYDSLFVPALFAQWASKVADAAMIQPGDRVLDVACGTGALTRMVQSQAGPGGQIVGLDPNPGMLAVAKDLGPTIDWRQGVAESLPFADASFDVVVSQFGLMFFADRAQALREMLRVLAPKGRLVVAVWDGLDSMPAYAEEVVLLDRLAGRAAADALRAPFVLGDRKELTAMFRDAGAVSIETTTDKGTARFPGIRVMVEADLRGWLPMMGIVLGEEHIESILREAETALAEHVGPDGGTAFDLSVHIVSARKS